MLKKFLSAALGIMLAVASVTVNFAGHSGYDVQAAESVAPNIAYYYDQLSESGKKIYLKIKSSLAGCQETVKINVNMNEKDFDTVAELLAYHDPEAFNISGIGARWNDNNYAEFNLEYRYDKDVYEIMTEDYNDKVDEILEKIDDDMSTYTKIRTIHDEIINAAVYDAESADSDTVYGALVDQKAKCDGYAKTFAYICGKIGIRTVTVIGEADRGDDNTEMHMWNKVYYNKKWYNVDVTWDDPVSDLKNNMSRNYFMLSDDEIGANHTEQVLSFTYPKAEDDEIDYFEVNKKYVEDLSSAKKIMKSGISSAAKKGTTSFEFKCSADVLKDVDKYLSDTANVMSMLESVNKSSGAKRKIIPTIYSYKADEDVNTIKIVFFYKGTTLEDYFIDPDLVSKDKIKMLAEVGIT